MVNPLCVVGGDVPEKSFIQGYKWTQGGISVSVSFTLKYYRPIVVLKVVRVLEIVM